MSDENQNYNNKIVMGSRAKEVVKCNKCGKEITVGESHSFKGENGEDIYFCDECLKEINSQLEAETKNQNIAGALILGIIAGIIGGLLWFGITVVTNTRIGYLAIALGFLIAIGVKFGAGNKKGLNLQILSAVIMTVCLLLSEFIMFMYEIGKQPDVNMSAIALLTGTILHGDLGKGIIFFFKHCISPMGVLICLFGIYMAYIIPKPSKL